MRTYSVMAGDTLRSIAQSQYGSASLWWKIADANGLLGDAGLQVGQVLSIPIQAGGSANSAGDFRVYDANDIVGDTSPNMPAPPPKKKNCGFLGKLIMIVVAAVVAFYTAGALGFGATGTSFAGNVAAGAIGGAAGSIASQIVGNAIGAIDGFSWKAVALAAIGGGVGGGLQGFDAFKELATKGFANTVARAMVGSAISQGIGVATGLQDKFSWASVAASGVGAGVGVGQAMSEALGITDAKGEKLQSFKDAGPGVQFGKSLAVGLAVGLAAGAATALARGGRVSITQVATDAFGNALGSYYTGEFDSERDPTSKNYRNEMDRMSDASRPQFRYDYRNGMDVDSDNYRPPQPAPSFSDDVARRKATLNPWGLPTQVRPEPTPVHSSGLGGNDNESFGITESDLRGMPSTAQNGARGGRILAQMRDADPTSQAAIERAALAASNSAAKANNPNFDSKRYPAFVSSGAATSATPSSAMYNTGAESLSPEFGGYAGGDASQTYAARVIRAGVGIVETVAAGSYNYGIRVLGGAASVPYALSGGVQAGVDVQQAINDHFGYVTRSAGAQDVAQVLASVGAAMSNASARVRAFSEGYIGDTATTILGGVLLAGVEIAGVTTGLNGVGRALGSADYIFVPSATPSLMGQRGIVSGGDWIRTVTPEMRDRFAGNYILDPTNNTLRALKAGETVAVDHIVPSKAIVDLPGFKTLTKQQKIDILQDNIGLGNLQPLPQGINASKGARLAEDWTRVGDTGIDATYRQNLGVLQRDIQVDIVDQIAKYKHINQLNRR